MRSCLTGAHPAQAYIPWLLISLETSIFWVTCLPWGDSDVLLLLGQGVVAQLLQLHQDTQPLRPTPKPGTVF